MTREQVDKVVEILQAFKNGKQLQWRPREKPNNKWNDCVLGNRLDVLLDELVLDYRIKPEPKLVPFTFEDAPLFRDKWVKRKTHGEYALKIHNYSKNGVVFENLGTIDFVEYKYFLQNYIFADTGEPCGKLIEE